jgi:glutaminyl-tRNA synthetase
LEIVRGCLVEPSLAKASPGEPFQFLRNGYFVADEVDSRPGAPIFNRTVDLKDRYRAGAPATKRE